MRVLVTGATGLVGRPLVRRLLAAGHEVRVLTRDPEYAELVLPVRCEFFPWAPERGNADPDAFEGLDAIVHLAGESVADGRWTPGHKQSIMRSRTDSTRVLLGMVGELAEADRPKTLVSSSAVGYYGDRNEEVLEEESSPGVGFLADVCIAWEHSVALAEDLGLRVVALRTGIVLSGDGGALARMLPPFRLGIGGRLGNGRQWMSWIHVEDLVSLYMEALTNEALAGPVNATAPTPVTNAHFTKALGKQLGRPTFLPTPALFLQIITGEMSEMLLGGQRVHPAVALAAGFRFDYPDVEGALRDLCADFAEELRSEIWLPAPPDEVFPFFSDAYNLEQLTPDFLEFRVLGTSTEQLSEGSTIDYRLRVRGVRLKWRSRIDVWDAPRSFVDTQVKGPYKSWRHTHEFEEFDGGTIVRDVVRYELPGGVLGAMVGGGFVRGDLGAAWDFRREAIFDHFDV